MNCFFFKIIILKFKFELVQSFLCDSKQFYWKIIPTKINTKKILVLNATLHYSLNILVWKWGSKRFKLNLKCIMYW